MLSKFLLQELRRDSRKIMEIFQNRLLVYDKKAPLQSGVFLLKFKSLFVSASEAKFRSLGFLGMGIKLYGEMGDVCCLLTERWTFGKKS